MADTTHPATIVTSEPVFPPTLSPGAAPPAAAPPAAAPPAAAPPAAAPRHKYRIRFRKAGDLRLVSHHDLMHCVERMLRRAGLPVAQTQGFHPQPRMVFALSLALGIVGSNEVLELELTQPLAAAEVRDRLARQAPPGIDIVSVRPHDAKAACQVRRAFYRLPLQASEHSGSPLGPCSSLGGFAHLAQRCAELLAQPHILVQRQRPQPRKLDIRPYLNDLQLRDGFLEIALWVTPNGTARPEEIALLLGLDQLLQDGAVFERTHLELADEAADASAPSLPIPGQTTPMADEDASPETPPEPRETKPNARPTALLSGPLSFDS